ncbi:MAG: SufD family Fe-S cluster assembly protein, partial [Promethearchaeota archaeon]
MPSSERKRKIQEKAKRAKDKPAALGPDVDLDQFEKGESSSPTVDSLEKLGAEEKHLLSEVGVDPTRKGTAGAYVQIDQEDILLDLMLQVEGLEIMPLSQALSRDPSIEELLWSLVPVDTDKYTSQVALRGHEGYFIRAKAGEKITEPVQSCLLMKTPRIQQNVHNLVIVEEDAELHLITGCATPKQMEQAIHLGISEFYLHKNAKLTFTMIHRWSAETEVRPRSAVLLQEGAHYISNYVILSSVRSLQSYPTVTLRGRNAKADLYSVVYGQEKSHIDIGGRLILEGPGTQGQMISRSVAKDHSQVIARGDLIGLHPDTRAHLACDGLLLSPTAKITAIPALRAETTGTALSHEATVGKVEAVQLNDLMSRGLTEKEATDLIVRG